MDPSTWPEDIDPELRKFLESAPVPPVPDWSDPKAFRKVRNDQYAAEVAALGPPGPGVVESSVNITMRDGYQNDALIWKPADAPAAGSPLVILFFGGGWRLGIPGTNTRYARGLVQLFGATCVSPNYRLAPENPFPTPVQDAIDAFKWVAAHASTELGATPSQGFIVAGLSAGANLAAVCVQQAKDDKIQPPVTGQWLSVPLLMHDSIVPAQYRPLYRSHAQNAASPGMGKPIVDTMMAHYAADYASPLFSPLSAASGLAGQPPAYLQVCGWDPLRDDGVVYEKMLAAAGVPTRIDAYPGVPHGFWLFFPNIKPARKLMLDIVKGFSWLLSKKQDEEIGQAAAEEAMGLQKD